VKINRIKDGLIEKLLKDQERPIFAGNSAAANVQGCVNLIMTFDLKVN
jgi:hypothetical protein